MSEEEEFGPLPAGRHGLSPEQVAHSQRERIVAAFAAAVGEHGYHGVTIAHITAGAKVSRRAFYQQFGSKEDCFLAAFDIVVEHIGKLIAETVQPIPDWPSQVIAALRALLGFLASEPDLARLCLVESLAAGPVVAERFRAMIDSFVPLLKPGRLERSSKRALPDSTEASQIGALVALLSRSISAGEAGRLEKLLPDLAEFALTPYLGPDQARRLAREAV